MKKALKGVAWFLAAVLLLLVVALAALPLWLGPAAVAVANRIVPSYTGTAFKMTSASLNPYTGKFLVQGVELANPAGYSPDKAVVVTDVSADVEMASLFSDVIHIREIVVRGPYASYVTKDGTNNFARLAAHAQGTPPAGSAPTAKQAPANTGAEKASGKKVIIDRLAILDPRLKVLVLPEMPFSDIVLKDIGRQSNGATLADVGAALANAVMEAAAAMGEGLSLLFAGTSAQAMNVSSNLSAGAGKVLESATKGLGKGLGETTKKLDGAAKKLGDFLKIRNK